MGEGLLQRKTKTVIGTIAWISFLQKKSQISDQTGIMLV